MLHLSQMVLFLSGNGGPWNCARYRLSTKGQYLQNMLMNFQNHSIPSFCSTHLLGGSRQRDILPNEIVQKMSAKIVMQVDFVENVTTKINCLRKSVYWPYNQLFAQHVFGSMGEQFECPEHNHDMSIFEVPR